MSIANLEFGDAAMSSRDEPGALGDRYELIKPWLDFLLALAVLPLVAPLVALAMALVKLTSRGPAIYAQKRLGLGGKIFTIYKIRTMYRDSERQSGPTWCLPGDPRVTPVGRILRWSHIDELPQLINIARGEMSLVGPRPERPEFLDELASELPDYRRRLTVRPGLTGLAQVRQPPDTSIDSVRRKLNYDLYYVERPGPWLDLRIVLGTALKCLGVPFAWIGGILRLPDPNARPESERPMPKTGVRSESLIPDSCLG